MKTFTTALFCACIALAAGTAAAEDTMKKDKEMTMQDCREHMAMSKKDGMKKDDAMMKKDATCKAMMQKDSSMPKN